MGGEETRKEAEKGRKKSLKKAEKEAEALKKQIEDLKKDQQKAKKDAKELNKLKKKANKHGKKNKKNLFTFNLNKIKFPKIPKLKFPSFGGKSDEKKDNGGSSTSTRAVEKNETPE